MQAGCWNEWKKKQGRKPARNEVIKVKRLGANGLTQRPGTLAVKQIPGAGHAFLALRVPLGNQRCVNRQPGRVASRIIISRKATVGSRRCRCATTATRPIGTDALRSSWAPSSKPLPGAERRVNLAKRKRLTRARDDGNDGIYYSQAVIYPTFPHFRAISRVKFPSRTTAFS